MAYRIFHACKTIANSTISASIRNNATPVRLLAPQVSQIQNTRNTSFFLKKSANELWKSVTSISNAGKRRGRGKVTPKIKDLNRGKKLGYGKVPVIFPGLNVPIVKGNILNKQQVLSQEEADAKQIVESSQAHILISKSKKFKIPALKRGWSGGRAGGRKIGPPDPINDDKFDGFETWILYHKMVSIMTNNMGRAKRIRCMVVTGNGKGLAGFAMLTGKDFKSTLNTVKNKAGQRLIYIERYNDHTVFHDFFTQFGKTKIFVEQKHKGYGLKCHRIIKACCEAIGITDLYAKLEGSNNAAQIVKAFFIGLLRQKTHEQMANEKQLHLVEMRKENSYFPTILASPPVVRDRSEIPSNENLNFNMYVMNGKIPHKRKKPPPFYTRLPSWNIYLRKEEHRRGQKDVLIRLRAEYGDVCSFLAEKYPEARASKWRKHDATNKEDTE
ncbi:28S ribosomal protein S5, mitochondrial [Anthophora quadrimaculata]